MPIPQVIKDLVHSDKTLTSVLAEQAATGKEVTPGDVIEKLYPHHGKSDKGESHALDGEKADLEEARQLGNFGNTQPSELFLKVSGNASLIRYNGCKG
jgi:hypothetical protein